MYSLYIFPRVWIFLGYSSLQGDNFFESDARSSFIHNSGECKHKAHCTDICYKSSYTQWIHQGFRLVLFNIVTISQRVCFNSNYLNWTGYQLDYRELARQNKITEQILQNYLEKRLFPHKHRPSQAPSIWDILPSRRRKSNNNIQDQLAVIRRENETLESGESNQVGAVYENNDDNIYEEEGMFMNY